MPISSDSIQVREVVWATPDDTLGQVRQRLGSAEMENRWQSHVLVLSVDGQYGVVPVSEIRPIVWAEGPAALRRPLRDLELIHFQPGVEQGASDLREAEQLADRYGGWLVVLQEGRFVGLIQGTREAASISLPPTDAFDLFDELLPDSALAQTEFLVATPNTTVAAVALDLKSARDSKSAYIIVREDDGSFRVVASEELNYRVQQADGDLWGMTLRQFVSHLPPAQVRERGMVGRRQAQELADKGDPLVITEEGHPVGLLLSQVVLRGAGHLETSPSILEGSFYTLFNVPQALLRAYQPQAGLETQPRFVNLWFENPDQRVVDREQPLLVGSAYNLALNVGRLREISIVGWDQAPAGPQAIVEPQEKEAYLYASLFSQDFDIPEPTLSLRLPEEGDADPVRSQVVPLRRSRGADLARLEVCLYYRTYLVQTFEIDVEVVAAGEMARSLQPQSAQLAHARTASFPDMEKLPPRELSLTITRDSADQYRFTFLVDPDAEDEVSAARAVELSCCVRLTRSDLTHLITKARRQLYNVVQSFDLLDDYDLGTFRKATRALAQVGRQLHLKLFESSAAQALKEWIETSLPDGSTIEIVDLAGDFVFPWSLVFTTQPWDHDKPVDVRKFWGWRYKLLILTSALLDTYRQTQLEVTTSDPLRLSVGMYERLVGTTEQKVFFEDLGLQTGDQVVPEILTNRRDMNRALAAADRDVYYFFCHGYTERIATDIQLDGDLLGHFARLAADTRDAALREHLDDLFDVSDSWMRLTRGKIPLAMLKETVPARFTRHPVVFLNMCESAQVLPSLSDGFVPFFLKRGARAVIGTECSMNTIFADDFARTFLTRFFQGEAMGDILLALRRQYLAQGNPLALAYTLYCDADLRLSEPLLPVDQPLDGETEEPESTERSRWAAVEVLWEDDMDGLMLTLAARVQAEEEGVAQHDLRMWNPPAEEFAADTEAGPEWTAKMVTFGQSWWDRFEPEIYDLLCNRNNAQHDELMDALKDGVKLLAVVLAPALVAQAAALPAVAIVLATIVAKKLSDTGLEAVCEMWAESMARTDEAGGGVA